MLITLYALGVVIGAPLVTIAAVRLPRARLLVLLIALIGLGNLLSAIAPDFTVLAAARFVAGLPHGAFFGVASLVAARLSPPGRRARSVSQVMLGLTIATMLGVPASTAFGQVVGWRSAYLIVVVVAVASTLAIWRLVPEPEGAGVTGSIRGELRALRRAQVWFALGIGSIGFGGMFAVYSYIGEIVPGVMGLGERAVPVALFVFGVGMTAGNILAGRLADRSVYGTSFAGLIGMALSLAVFALVAEQALAGMALLLVIAITSQLMGPSLQLFLLDASPDAPSLAAALHHSALNIGNSLGAALGAAVLAAGWGLLAPAWTGVVLAVLGLGIASWSLLVHRRQRSRAAAAQVPTDTAEVPAAR
jgi:DHA1 family inner membrane transport protein